MLIEVVGALEKKLKGPGPRPDYFFVLFVDEKMVLKSERVPRDAPRWTVQKPPRFNLTSTIKIAVYLLSPTGQRVYLKKSPLAECKVRGIDLLNEGVEHELTNAAGAKIVARLAVTLDVTLEFRAGFMKTIDKDLAHLAEVRGGDGARSAITVGEKIGTIIQKIMPIIDNFASSHSVLKLAWIALSSTYKAMQTQVAEDSIVRDLVDSLCEMTSAASAYFDLLEINDAADLIDAIGRTSIDVALLVHKHADITPTCKASTSGGSSLLPHRLLDSSMASGTARTAGLPLPDMASQIVECKRQCAELTAKLSPGLQVQTEPEAEAIGNGVRGHQGEAEDVRGDPAADPSRPSQNISMGHMFNTIGVLGSVTNIAGNYNHVVHEGTDVLQAGVDEIQGTVSLIRDEQKKEAIKNWMRAPDTELNYGAARGRRQSGTGAWFVDGSIFEMWKAHPGSVLWLHGGPGCGKTVLCSSAIENVQRSCQNKDSIGYAYFFFDGTSALSKLVTHESLIRSLIMQFSGQLDGIHPALASLYDLEGKGRHQPLISSLEGTLLEIIKAFPSSYILIDALDECAEQRRLLKWIHYIALHASGSLHLMVTSRPEPDIKGSLGFLSNVREVDLIHRQESNDILDYIDARLAEVDGWTEPQKALVRSALSRGAAGVFRWVVLLFDELLSERCLSESELRDRLKILPKDLNEAYMKIIKRSPRPADVIRFLQWIMFGRKEFTAEELAEVALINFGNGGDALPFCDSSRRYSSPDDVLRACSGLVVEVKEGTIKLAHLSVKEFLLSTEIPLGTAHSIRIDEHLSHCSIAEVCLAYLLQFDKRESITDANLESFPLAMYASKQCVFHVQAVSCRGMDFLLKQFMQTLAASGIETSYALNNWIRLLGSGRGRRRNFRLGNAEDLEDTISSLYYASIIGLTPLVDQLINNGADINALGGRWGTALQAASFFCNLEMCQLLVERGADVNVIGGMYGTALQAASYGDYKICQLLLERGADVNATGGEWGTALQAASHLGRLEICQLLLEHGADVNVAGGEYSTALQAASYWGRLEICQLLLERGAEVNAMGGKCGTALQAASLGDSLEICQLLLEQGANVNATGGEYGTALQAASYEGHLEICQLLLDHGADVNITAGEYGTALNAARAQSPYSWQRKSEVAVQAMVQLLKEYGAVETEALIESDES
ncbi:hypothetical protein HWV62_30933 [Athelia sp. TMB]|nr:hypothetical protein HWV62_30933 [Athelia sp. TMB]